MDVPALQLLLQGQHDPAMLHKCLSPRQQSGSAGSAGGPPSAQPRVPSLVRAVDTSSAGTPGGTPTSPPSRSRSTAGQQQQQQPAAQAGAARRSARQVSKRKSGGGAAQQRAPKQQKQQPASSEGEGTFGSHASGNHSAGPVPLGAGGAAALSAQRFPGQQPQGRGADLLGAAPAEMPLDLPGLDGLGDFDDVPGLDDLLQEESLLNDPFAGLPGLQSPWEPADAPPFGEAPAPVAPAPAPAPAPQPDDARLQALRLHVRQRGMPPGPFAQDAAPAVMVPQGQGQPLAMDRSGSAEVPAACIRGAAQPAAPQAAVDATASASVARELKSAQVKSARQLLAAALAARLRRLQQQQAAEQQEQAAAAAASGGAPPLAATAASSNSLPQVAAGPVFSGSLASADALLAQHHALLRRPQRDARWLVRDPSSLQPVKRGAVSPALQAVDASSLALSPAAPLVAAGRLGAAQAAAAANLPLLRGIFGSHMPPSWQ